MLFHVQYFQKNPESRKAQKRIAEEVTKLVHGGNKHTLINIRQVR